MAQSKGEKLVSMSELLYRTGTDISLNELRCLIQYEGVPVYTDGRTRTRLLDEEGSTRVEKMIEKYRRGRADYCNPGIHKTFAAREGADGK